MTRPAGCRSVGIQLVFLVTLFLCLFSMISKEIDLTHADLGRHFRNGQLILDTGLRAQVLTSNTYSYSNPTYPFINHSWGAGVVFEEIRRWSGFIGLSVFQISITLATFGLALLLTSQLSNLNIAMALGAVTLPLFASRTEVRPELFTYLFLIIFIAILEQWRLKRAPYLLRILPILQALWVNLHIYFFFGILSITAYFLNEFLLRRAQERWKGLGVVLVVSAFSLFLNPIGIRLIYYPLLILKDYGYPLLENASLWEVQSHGLLGAVLPSFYVVSMLYFGSALIWLIRRGGSKSIQEASSLPLLILSLISFGMTCMAARNTLLFGLISMPAVGSLFQARRRMDKPRSATIPLRLERSFYFVSFIVGTCLLLFLVLPQAYDRFGFGLARENEGSDRFFILNKLRGPVFNNFDIGSYLVYSLYPNEKVFVDNRPEAYPSEFFRNEYIPMQEDREAWRKADGKYKFQAIFITARDLTPWGNSFRQRLISDPEWAPVYLDRFAVIFVRNTAENRDVIRRYGRGW